MNILVTGIGGDIGQSVIKCLRESGYAPKIVGCDMDEHAAGRVLVDEFEVAPPVGNTRGYQRFIGDMMEKYGIKYIFPIPEAEIWFHHGHRGIFKAEVMINNPRTIEVGFDKYKMTKMLEACELPYPKTYPISKFAGNLDYPFLIKAPRGSGGESVVVARDYDDVKYWRRRMFNAIAQEIIGTVDGEYTVGVFSDGKRVYSICFRRYLGYDNMSKYVELVHCEEIQKIVERIAEALHLVGSMNVQFRKGERDYVPFEINSRLSSSVYFRHRFGFTDVKWWIDIKEGNPINYKLKYNKGVGVRTVGEVFFGCE